MEMLLKGNIGLQFVTKAMVPTNFLDLFAKYPGSVRAQVGLTCMDDNVRRIFEPGAAEVGDRLSTLRSLVSVGVKTSARADPLIHAITDSNESLTRLFSGIKGTGVKEVAVSYLFLRPAIRKSLERNIKNKNLLHKLLAPYSNAKTLPIGTRNSHGAILPEGIRRKAFERIKNIASDLGISVHFCGCKNPDITNESCYITRLTHPAQFDLFSQRT
jgi:DNA repair photolyase